MKDKTSTLLVQQLKAKLDLPYAKTYAAVTMSLIDDLEKLRFDDFHSDYALPKTQLLSILQKIGFMDLARNLHVGMYDADPPEI